jgi:hypothetical protein
VTITAISTADVSLLILIIVLTTIILLFLLLQHIPTVDQMASAVHSMMMAHGVTAATVIGHSYGTMIASRLVQMRGEVVHTLVLLDPVSDTRPAELLIVTWVLCALLASKCQHACRFPVCFLHVSSDYMSWNRAFLPSPVVSKLCANPCHCGCRPVSAFHGQEVWWQIAKVREPGSIPQATGYFVQVLWHQGRLSLHLCICRPLGSLACPIGRFGM